MLVPASFIFNETRTGMLQTQICYMNKQKLPINLTSALTFSIFLALQDMTNANTHAFYTCFIHLNALWCFRINSKDKTKYSNIYNTEIDTCNPFTFPVTYRLTFRNLASVMRFWALGKNDQSAQNRMTLVNKYYCSV